MQAPCQVPVPCCRPHLQTESRCTQALLLTGCNRPLLSQPWHDSTDGPVLSEGEAGLLQAHFGVGLKEAAKRLGVCATTLKRACRRHGIKRWPRRQLMKLSRALDGVEQVTLRLRLAVPASPP